MTEIKTILSTWKDHGFSVLLVPEGRKLYFDKKCLEAVTIQRKANDGEWEVLAKNTRTPYVDSEKFNLPIVLTYKVHFKLQEQCETVVEVHLTSK